jgi:hypothetical protein
LDERTSPGDRHHIHKELCQNSGCDHVWVRSWVLHETYKTAPVEIALCPHCGKRLRTPSAKQCGYCRKDCHLTADFVWKPGLTVFETWC